MLHAKTNKKSITVIDWLWGLVISIGRACRNGRRTSRGCHSPSMAHHITSWRPPGYRVWSKIRVLWVLSRLWDRAAIISGSIAKPTDFSIWTTIVQNMQPINMNVNPGSDGPLVLHGLFVGPGGVGGHGLGVGLLAGVGGVSCAVSVIVPILRALVKTNAKKGKT